MTLADRLCTLARGLPDVTETVACAGTAIEQASFRVGTKSFLFVQAKDGGVVVRLKLSDSMDAVEACTEAEVGVGGWVTVRVGAGEKPPGRLNAWVKESYALSSAPRPSKKKAVAKKKTAAKRKSRAKSK